MDLTFRYPEEGAASRYVSALPDEFIKYELESQGVRIDKNYLRRKKQLADLLESRLFKIGKYFVAIGYREDIEVCSEHLDNWRVEYDETPSRDRLTEVFIVRLRHLHVRLSMIVVADHDENYKKALSMLKSRIITFKNRINTDLGITPPPVDMPSVSNKKNLAQPRSRNIDDWSYTNTSPNKIDLADHTKLASSQNKNVSPNDSLLDFSLQMHEDYQSKRLSNGPIKASTFHVPHPSSHVSFTPNVDSQTYIGPNGSMFPIKTSYVPERRIEMWKWGFKFTGDPKSMPAREFIQKIAEHADTRGASKEELLKGVIDLLDGTALKWYRAGKQDNLFRDWYHFEALLLHDFQDSEYGDSLWDAIRSRMQGPNESIVSYFAVMEDMFLNLSRPASDIVKASIIKKNLRAEFIHGLGVNEYNELRSLKNDCRTIESNFLRIKSRQSALIPRNPYVAPRYFKPHNVPVQQMDEAMFGKDDCYREIPEEMYARNVAELSQHPLDNFYSPASSDPISHPSLFDPRVPPPSQVQYSENSRHHVNNEKTLAHMTNYQPNLPQTNRQYYAPKRALSGNEWESREQRMGSTLHHNRHPY